jgi:predicted RNase H-like nuclease (RuvC/YqgF family)
MSAQQSPSPSPSADHKSSGGDRRRHRGRRGGRGRSRSAQAKPAHGAQAVAPPEAAPLIERGAALTEQVAAKRTPHISAISQAIEEVMQIVDSLKHAVEQMEEVLELVELAERQKLADEQEIESLRRALRQLHRPRGARHTEAEGHGS